MQKKSVNTEKCGRKTKQQILKPKCVVDRNGRTDWYAAQLCSVYSYICQTVKKALHILDVVLLSAHTLQSHAEWENRPTSSFFFVFFFGIVGVESNLGPLGTSATYWPIVPAPGDCEDGEFGGMKYSEKTCPNATLSTTNPTWPDPGLNPGHHGGKPATNRFSYGAAPLPDFQMRFIRGLLGKQRKKNLIQQCRVFSSSMCDWPSLCRSCACTICHKPLQGETANVSAANVMSDCMQFPASGNSTHWVGDL
jgi:hypothetical protein